MSKNKIVDIVSQFSRPIISEMGYKLIKVEYVRESNTWVLRLYIDKKGGITIEDCEHVSNVISKELDIRDIIPQHYFLEVSSAGLERELYDEEDIRMHLNDNAVIKLNNGEIIEGLIHNFENNTVYLDDGKDIKAISMNGIKKIKLKFKF
ncbi:MAG: ribosome maturation factor RimP [Thermoanaerobacteraceae bacterium]|nr:ribosome maturation factor RimP [Thermoanaerobacteraceae bacterium]